MHKSIPLVVSLIALVGFLIGFSLLAAARGPEGGGAGFGLRAHVISSSTTGK